MKDQKFSYAEYKALLNLSLGEKIERAHMLIIDSLQKFNNNVVACSWGKDKIPRNPLYDLMPRNGCMPCTGFKNWAAVMAKANPKLYDFVSIKMGQSNLNCFAKEVTNSL